MVWLLLAVLIVALISLPLGLLLHRRLRQRRNAAKLQIRGAHGIVEEGFKEIGGIEQWIGIRGEDEKNPVLLFVHGGPGASCSIFTPGIRSWENYFTVVQWDQRGSSKTLGKTGQDGTGELMMDRLIRDGESRICLTAHGVRQWQGGRQPGNWNRKSRKARKRSVPYGPGRPGISHG